jgi:hypothetical protein
MPLTEPYTPEQYADWATLCSFHNAPAVVFSQNRCMRVSLCEACMQRLTRRLLGQEEATPKEKRHA